MTGNFAVEDGPDGEFFVISDIVGAVDLVADFDYHVVDVYPADDSDERRAKVVSTSDPQGEWITISEVAAIGTDAVAVPAPESDLYRGVVVLSSDAANQGKDDGKVWVQDGDTVTVRYVNSDGNTLDTDTLTVDGVKPAITDITPANGAVVNSSNPALRFDVVDEGSKLDTNNLFSRDEMKDVQVWINDEPVQTGSFQGSPDRVTYIFATSKKWTDSKSSGGFGVVSGEPFKIKITAVDIAGNMASVDVDDAGEGGHEVTVDTETPAVTAAESGIGWNRSKAEETENDNTGVKVMFSDDIDPDSVDASDFTVDGVRPSAADVGTTEEDEDTDEIEKTTNNVYLTVAALAPDATPQIIVTGEVLDIGGNALDTDSEDDSERTAEDRLDPSITVSVDTELAVKDDEVVVTIDSDERLSTADGVTISINGPRSSGSANPGDSIGKATTPTQYEGSATVKATFGTGTYGVSVRVKDTTLNESNNLKSVTDEKADVAEVDDTGEYVIKLEMGPIADKDFSGDVDLADLDKLMVDNVDMSTSTGVLVDASERTITVPGLGADAEVVVSYKYVEQTFQVDLSAPTVSFNPEPDAEVENTSPFIRIVFDEDEYPGDDFKTVTLTKADLTMPDGTTTSVMDDFATTDWITYLWAASDLALGEYTLKVSGTDEAGNSIEDETTSFEIVARKLVTIDLTPGWNLISLPGMPANTDVNAVITNMDVSAVVTYDPSVPGGWAQAVRETATSSLSGTLMTISGNTGIWIKTSSFKSLKVDIPPVGQGTIPPSFTLLAGWNLVPVVAVEAGVEDVEADKYFTGLKWSRAYGYDSLTGTLQGFLPGGGVEDKVEVGKGYWVFVSEDGTLVP